MTYSIQTLKAIGAFVALCAMTITAAAAPITYKFQATVGPLPPFNDDVGLPFTLEEGSVIDGRLTIDSTLDVRNPGNSSESTQPFAIEFSFSGYSFGAEQYSTGAFDNASIGDSSISGHIDIVQFSCSSSSLDVACSQQRLEFPGSPPLRFSLSADFIGDSGIFIDPALPSDVSGWNSFALRRQLTFVFTESPGNSAGYFSTLGEFAVVPEPNTLFCLWIVFGQILCWRTSRVKPSYGQWV